MFGSHGWFAIRAPAAVQDAAEHDRRERQIIMALGELIDGLRWTVGGPDHPRPDSNAVIDFGAMNGACFLHLRGHKNHRASYWTDIHTLLEWICREAPGSFGLLYWRDDEGELPAGPNNFQVIVMARGQLTTRLDPFLSPTIPMTEDAWDGLS